MPIINLVADICIRSKWFISATRFGEQAREMYSDVNLSALLAFKQVNCNER